MSYHSPPVGNNMSWIFWGLHEDYFTNPRKLKSILAQGLREDKLRPLGWHVHKFGSQAYTILVPLSESHLSVHSYREYDCLAFSLYSCLGKDSGYKTYQKCLEKIKPLKHLLIAHPMPIDSTASGDLETKILRNS